MSFYQNPIKYCNMAIYCNTLKRNIQYGIEPYCFTPNMHVHVYIVQQQSSHKAVPFHCWKHPESMAIDYHWVEVSTVFIRIEAWAFISYKRFLTQCLHEPFLYFT